MFERAWNVGRLMHVPLHNTVIFPLPSALWNGNGKKIKKRVLSTLKFLLL
jgi:hypothetical protein